MRGACTGDGMNQDTDKSGLARRTQLRRANQTLASARVDSRQERQSYVEAIVAHLRDKGRIICVSDDATFTELLRGLVRDELKMPAASVLASSGAEHLLRLARQAVEAKESPLLLVEQEMRGHDLTFAVRMLKTGFPELRVLMLTRESERERFALLHESGVEGCIVKPVDAPALLERLALTVKPKGQVERSLEWARSLLAQGENLRALQVCMQALEQKSNSAAVLLLMGDIFKAMEEYDKAAEAWNKAAGGSSLFLEPLRKLADLYAERGNTERELECLERMDEVSPLNLERKLKIGELSLKLRKPDKARKIFGEVVKLSKRRAGEGVAAVALRVADIYTESDPESAASFLRDALEARREFWGPEDIVTFNKLGLLLRRSGKWREAAEEYLRALTVMPNDEKLHYNLAMAWLEGKDYEKARASCLKALALNPELPRTSPRIAINLATAFMGTGDKMHALPLLRTALELEPDNAEATALMAQADSREG